MKHVPCTRQSRIAEEVRAHEEGSGFISWLVETYKEVGKECRHDPEMYKPVLYPTIKALLAITELRFKEGQE